MKATLVPICLLALLACACQNSGEAAPARSDPATEPNAGEPAAAPAAEAEPPPAAETPEEPATVDRERAHAFCIDNYEQMMECIDDQSFWRVMATIYFQTDPDLQANPAAKPRWIEMMKDAARTLEREGSLDDNCTGTVEHNKWPTEAQIERVAEARALSCADFGNAYGHMMFNEGVFHDPAEH